VRDVFDVYNVIRGPDEGDMLSYTVPHGIKTKWSLRGGRKDHLEGWKIGVCSDWLKMCDDDAILNNYRSNITLFEKMGAKIVDFHFPAFEQIRTAHTCSIVSEMAATMEYYDDQLHKMMAMTNMTMGINRMFDAVSYVQSQKIRAFAIATFGKLFKEEFDVIVTPTTGALPPRFYGPGGVDMNEGLSDMKAMMHTMAYAFLANILGIPGISVVNGYDKSSNLPTGLQVMSNFACEDDALYIAEIVERNTKKTAPKVFFDNLK
jgi:Asp-tRNA(Asn)/Glu-tRNA(Gln) amidotransferase A subunit family amidase